MGSHFIGIDWGTSIFRAYLYDVNAQTISEKRVSERGIATLGQTEVANYLQNELQPWLNQLDANITVIGSGMIGSDLGLEWVDYVQCPTHCNDLYKFTRKTSKINLNLWLVPGLSFRPAQNEFDTMRGEETQLLGLDLDENQENKLVCMPGTHSKWIHLRKGQVVAFRTALTGELYSSLKNSTLVRGPQVWDQSAFELGLQKGISSTALLSNLFGVRTLGIFKVLAPAHAQSYLSGLLVASEIAEMRAFFAEELKAGTITIVGTAALSQSYASAFRYLQIPVDVVQGEQASSAGYFKLYYQLSSL